MKILLFIFVISINKSFSINGVIWNNRTKTFVPIFSIERFNRLHDEVIKKFVEEEHYRFNGQEISLVYYDVIIVYNFIDANVFMLKRLLIYIIQEKDVFEFYDDDRKVTGICGDLWTTLSEYLNFT